MAAIIATAGRAWALDCDRPLVSERPRLKPVAAAGAGTGGESWALDCARALVSERARPEAAAAAEVGIGGEFMCRSWWAC